MLAIGLAILGIVVAVGVVAFLVWKSGGGGGGGGSGGNSGGSYYSGSTRSPSRSEVRGR